MLQSLFKSKSRAELFRVLFGKPNNSFYLRELERMTSSSKTALEKELKHLVSAGFIESTKDGNRVYYQVKKSHPLFPELFSIVEKSAGVSSLLKQALNSPKIHLALLFGSFVRGTLKAESDIDLIIVGEIGMRQFSKMVSGIQENVGREINPHIYSVDDFKSKIKNRDHFLNSVLDEEFTIIKGDLCDYK